MRAGGEAVAIWLMNILNAVVELELVPPVLKRGVVVPVYKGGEKDPMKIDSYRGITLTTMIAKVLEFLLIDRLDLAFLEAGLPHINQSAYTGVQSRVRTQSLLHKSLLLSISERVVGYTCACLYDLQNVFDSVEYPVLLD